MKPYELFAFKYCYMWGAKTFRLIGKCADEKILVAVDEVYHFGSVDIGEAQNFSCIYGQTDEAKRLNKTTILSRACVFSNVSYSAQWQPLDLSTCKRNPKEKTLENIDVVSTASILTSSKYTNVTRA